MRRGGIVPGRLALAQVEGMPARDEAQLAAYSGAAGGLDPGHAHGLARFAEERSGSRPGRTEGKGAA